MSTADANNVSGAQTESHARRSASSAGYLSAVEVHDPASQQSASWSGGTSKPNAQRYRCIVADPPWEIGDLPAFGYGKEADATPCPYPTMTLDAIKALPVRDLAEADCWHVNGARGGCNLFLWTTTQFLYDAHDVVRAWGFKPTAVLVWCKPPLPAGLGGTFKTNVEFVVVGRRGSPPRATGGSPTRWFNWPRGKHSEKPEAFLDMIEQVNVGPYLELFARRQRLGWHSWGNQALCHVSMNASEECVSELPKGETVAPKGRKDNSVLPKQ